MKNKEALVSIIIPVYKVEQYLDRCFQSIVNQSYNNIEILLIDDGSPDRCGEMCDKYSTSDNRVKVIHKDNGGLSDARNVGIRHSTGDYIMFVDSDDYIELEAVEKLLKFAITNDLDIGCANVYRIIDDGEIKKILLGGENETDIVNGESYLINAMYNKKYTVAVTSRIYKSDFIKKNHLYFKKSIYHEDEDWTPRVFLQANRVLYLNYTFYCYLIRKNSITQTGDRSKHIKDVIETCLTLEKEFEKVRNDRNRKILKDYLCKLYINTCTYGKYDKKFYKTLIDKSFISRNSYFLKSRIECFIYKLNIRGYRAMKILYIKHIL